MAIIEDKKRFFKGAAKFVGSACVGSVISLLIEKNLVPKNMGEKVSIKIGAFIIGAMVSDKAEEFIGNQYDDIMSKIEEIKNETPEKADIVVELKKED